MEESNNISMNNFGNTSTSYKVNSNHNSLNSLDDEMDTISSTSYLKDKKPTGDDWVADWLLKTYVKLTRDNSNNSNALMTTIGFCVGTPIALVLFFALFISNSTPNLIAFIALVTALVFVGVSMWMLCWILAKDEGSRAMQDVSDPIKEGSEGFFITQYGTIFKLALACAALLFLVYLQRSPATSGDSQLHLYISNPMMALVTSVSFLLGANCSALAGYAGIWVSVRANVRVAAAARKDYNDALQICLRGGAFSAIINVSLAIFGISFMFLAMSFLFFINGPEGVAHPPIEEIPVLLVGFGFGASFVAMFA